MVMATLLSLSKQSSNQFIHLKLLMTTTLIQVILSVDDNYTVDLGGNIQVIQVFEDGWIEIQQDFMQNIDQDIVQDVYYEVELIQDIVQDVEINQTYTYDEIVTETRTRLVGE
jgi:hypothetical protein